MKKRKLLSTYILFFLIIITILSTCFNYNNYKNANENEVLSTMKSYEIKIQDLFDDMNFSMDLVETIIQLDYTRFTEEELEFMFFPIINQHEVRNASILPDGIVEYIYPIEGNEEAIGDNIFELPNRQKEAQIALDTDGTILSGPYTLTQGGSGLITRKAIYIEENGREEFWGFAAIVMDTQVVLEHLDLQAVTSLGFDYLLTADVNGEDTRFIEGNENLDSDNAQYVTLDLPNGSWTLGLSKDFDLSQIISICSFFLIGIALSLLLYAYIFKKEKEAYNSNRKRNIDPLTQVYNRNKLEEISYTLSKRNNKKYTVVFIDLDNFKPINDVYGHNIGDEYLIYIAKLFKSITRDNDLTIRIGGDEFVILLQSVSEIENIEKFMQRLEALQQNFYEWDGNKIPVDFSYGYEINRYPNDQSFSSILEIADKKMYDNKNKKKMRIE